ncbi:hypothetical protein BS47DRAFT_1365949 [Hydnum rufescens UP504]|uniref:Uncharacterized protein n=1 Tax=Hydnum rufescens UP504 TaxID=1448309 RepID=A0A9P6DSD1_9AGAM|nr:hypothetical protein BS47DRAFT_1365949 [Hydnum rufescens UP504]
MTIQFYCRLFVINTKQVYIDGQNLCKLASHQKWRFDNVVAKLDEAEGALDRLAIPINKIQTAWAKQLSTQQAEPPHVLNLFLQINLLTSGNLVPKKDAGMKTIKSILNLLQTCTTLRRQITLTSSQQASILLHDPSSPDCIKLLDRLDQLQLSLEQVESQLAKKNTICYFMITKPKFMRRKQTKSDNLLSYAASTNSIKKSNVAIITYLDWKGCHAELNIIKREVANMHVWYAEEHDAIQTAIHEAGTDSALCFHLLHKFTDLNNLRELWDHSLSRLPYPSNLRSIMPFALNSVHADVTRVHTLSTPFPEGLTHELDSDGEDCIEQREILAVTSEVLRKIDDDEECSQCDICSDDSIALQVRGRMEYGTDKLVFPRLSSNSGILGLGTPKVGLGTPRLSISMHIWKEKILERAEARNIQKAGSAVCKTRNEVHEIETHGEVREVGESHDEVHKETHDEIHKEAGETRDELHEEVHETDEEVHEAPKEVHKSRDELHKEIRETCEEEVRETCEEEVRKTHDEEVRETRDEEVSEVVCEEVRKTHDEICNVHETHDERVHETHCVKRDASWDSRRDVRPEAQSRETLASSS